MRTSFTSPLMRLRHNPAAAIVAVWLMLLQVIFSTEHLSAMASMQASGGFLAICHGDAATTKSPAAPADGRLADKPACMLCASFSAAGTAVDAAPPQLHQPFIPLLAIAATAYQSRQNPTPLLRYGTVRGPPALLQA